MENLSEFQNLRKAQRNSKNKLEVAFDRAQENKCDGSHNSNKLLTHN